MPPPPNNPPLAIGGLLPLIGRDGPLSDVQTVLGGARAARGGLVLVTGDPGIGKTRLAEEAAAHAKGFRVVWSWCASDPTARSFRPWAQVVRALAAAHTHAAR